MAEVADAPVALAGTSLVLTEAEVQQISGGYVRPSDQLRFLHQRGFYRAVLHRGRVLLERSHYLAVTTTRPAEVGGRRPMRASERAKLATA